MYRQRGWIAVSFALLAAAPPGLAADMPPGLRVFAEVSGPSEEA